MAEQLPLDIPLPPVERRETAFFAIMPRAGDTARLTALGKQISPARLHPAWRFHISLLGLGLSSHSRDADIDGLRNVGEAVTAPPFEVALPMVCSFGDSLALCCDGDTTATMAQLQHALLRAAEMRWGPLGRRRYAPHLTLAYRAPRIAPLWLEDPIRWPVREFVLISSDRARGGYGCLGRWRLR